MKNALFAEGVFILSGFSWIATARLQLMIDFTLRRAIPRQATRTTMHLDSVSAKLRDRLRWIIGHEKLLG
jgi:hypothetical protein